MRWSAVVIGILTASGLASEAPAFSLGTPQQAPLAEPAAAPPAPADLVLPPHLTGALPTPPGWAVPAQGLPTFQDLMAAWPTYTAPPPTRRRIRQR